MEITSAKSQNGNEKTITKRGRIELNEIGKTFFVGNCKYNMIKKRPIQIFLDYAKYVIGEGYGTFLSYSQSQMELFVPNVLLQMFYAIMIYNNILTPVEVKYVEVINAFPDFMVFHKDDNVFYIATANIIEFLKKKEGEVNITFNMDCDFTPEDSSGEEPQVNIHTLQKLFVIADHCATHYLELLEFGKTDLYCHQQFGTGSYITMGSRFNILTHRNYTAVRPNSHFLIESSYVPITKTFMYQTDFNSINYQLIDGASFTNPTINL